MQTRKLFRFFDLPRELRITFYAENTIDIPAFSCGDIEIHNVKALAFCEPTLRLVNKQLKQEYEEEIFRHAVITVASEVSYDDEHPDAGSLIESLLPSTFLPLVQHVTLRLHIATLQFTSTDHLDTWLFKKR